VRWPSPQGGLDARTKSAQSQFVVFGGDPSNRRVVVVTPVSIVKIVASASVFIAVGSAALVFGVAHVEHEERLAADAVTATSAPQAAPAVRSDASPAATGANPAATTAELAGPPEAAGKDQSSLSVDVARVEAGGDAVIAGRPTGLRLLLVASQRHSLRSKSGEKS
jgi:hypothetical protein